MRNSSLLILIAAVVMGLTAAVLARSYLQSRTDAPSGTIVVAVKSLAFGTSLTRDNTAEIAWSADALPQGAFATRQALFKDGERVVLTPLSRSEPVLSSKITGPGQRGSLSALLEGDMRAVTVRVDDVRGVAGFILPGDRVDVVLIRGTGSSNDQTYADVIIQNVKVLAVDQFANERPDKPSVVAKAVTLAVTPEQAQKVLLATNIGKLSLTLRQPGQAGPEAMRRITERDLALSDPEPVKPSAAAPAPVPVSRNATVVVVHGTKAQEYTVKRDGL